MPADTRAKAGVDRDPVPHAPKTRDEVVQENRHRRQAEPAVAPIEADGEAGNPTGRHGGDPLPRDAAGRPRDPAAEAVPRTLPEELQRDRGGWGRVIAVLAAGAVLVLLIGALV